MATTNLITRIYADAIQTGDRVDLDLGSHIDVDDIAFRNVGAGMVRITGTWNVTGKTAIRDFHTSRIVTVTRKVTQ